MPDKGNTIFGTSHARTVWKWHSLLQWFCVHRLSVCFVKSLFVVSELCKYCGVKSIIFKSYLDWQFTLKMPSSPTYCSISGGLMLGEIAPVQGTAHGCYEKLCGAPNSCGFSLRWVEPQADKTRSYFLKGLEKVYCLGYESQICAATLPPSLWSSGEFCICPSGGRTAPGSQTPGVKIMLWHWKESSVNVSVFNDY